MRSEKRLKRMDTKQPNIILITTDQQRYDSIKANGSMFMNTPHMDRLAKEGVSFRRAYCPNTICTPSRVSIMSGMHLSRHGSYNIGTTTSHYSTWISTLLREHGYQTHHVGKAHWHPWGRRVQRRWKWMNAEHHFTISVGLKRQS